MTNNLFEVETGLSTLECAACAMFFAIPAQFMRNRRRDHEEFYCPSGHKNYYTGKSDIEIAKEKTDNALREVDKLRECIGIKKNIIRTKDYQVRHYKGEVTKLRKVKP